MDYKLEILKKKEELAKVLLNAGFKDMPLLYELSKIIKNKFNFLQDLNCSGKSDRIDFLKFENNFIEYNYIFSRYRWDLEFNMGRESFVKGDYGNIVVKSNFENVIYFFIINKKNKLFEFHSYNFTSLELINLKTYNWDCLKEFEDYIETFKKNELEFHANERYTSHVISNSERYKKLDNQFIESSFVQANKFISLIFLKGKEIKKFPDFLDVEYIKKHLLNKLILRKSFSRGIKGKEHFYRNDNGEVIIKEMRTDNVLTIFIMSWNSNEFNLIIYISSIFHKNFLESNLFIFNSFFDNINKVRSRYSKHILNDENQIINWNELNEIMMKTQLKDSIELINSKYNEENTFQNELSFEFLRKEKQETELKRIQKLF